VLGKKTPAFHEKLSKHTPGWLMVLAEEFKALIRNRHPTLIWIDCAEREVFCSCLAFGQHIEEGRFPAMEE